MQDPIDIGISYEEVSNFGAVFDDALAEIMQAVPLMQELPEFKALEDEEGRRVAFTKFVKRQKVWSASTDIFFISRHVGTVA